jgi:hypothetical protein
VSGAEIRPDDASFEQLVAVARQFENTVTYDDVNEHMPLDMITTEQIDVWLEALDERGIRVIDPRERRKDRR